MNLRLNRFLAHQSRGQHLNDIVIFTSIFFRGEVLAYAASLGHHIDIGGRAAGPNAHPTDVYSEGLRIPPTRFDTERGVLTSGHDTTNAIGMGHLGKDGYRVYMEVVGGGWGASAGADGADVVDSYIGNWS